MIEILSATALATVQDLGREGYRRYGVGASGVMDRLALVAGNILVGNEEGAAGLEIPVFPFAIRFRRETTFAVVGADCGATLDGAALPPWWATSARAGQVLKLGVPSSGTYSYVTISGGVDVPVILGSRSTHLRGEFGGLDGRMLRAGDVLAAVDQKANPAIRMPPGGFGAEPPRFALPLGGDAAPAITTVRVLPAAEYDRFDTQSQQSFWAAEWKITPQSNRAGYRLAGPSLNLAAPIEMRSHGLVPGVIQVPHGGQPIIQMADAYTAGGYPKIGTVIDADLWRIGQARLGSSLRFLKTGYDEAVAALDAVSAYLGKVRTISDLYRAAA